MQALIVAGTIVVIIGAFALRKYKVLALSILVGGFLSFLVTQ